jgi:hypothetical protein
MSAVCTLSAHSLSISEILFILSCYPWHSGYLRVPFHQLQRNPDNLSLNIFISKVFRNIPSFPPASDQIWVKARTTKNDVSIRHRFQRESRKYISLPILRNLVFERRPLHARHVFHFVIHPMLVLLIFKKNCHFFSLLSLPPISFTNAPQYNAVFVLFFIF